MFLFIILFSFFSICFYGYWAHRFLHSKYSGRFHNSHLTHHNALYPANDYLSKVYRKAGKDDSSIAFALFAIPLLFCPLLLAIFHLLSFKLAFLSLFTMLITGAFHNYIHEWFHIKDHWLNKLSWFKRLNELHYLHHIDQTKNFGIFWFFFDRMFNSFKKD